MLMCLKATTGIANWRYFPFQIILINSSSPIQSNMEIICNQKNNLLVSSHPLWGASWTSHCVCVWFLQELRVLIALPTTKEWSPLLWLDARLTKHGTCIFVGKMRLEETNHAAGLCSKALENTGVPAVSLPITPAWRGRVFSRLMSERNPRKVSVLYNTGLSVETDTFVVWFKCGNETT